MRKYLAVAKILFKAQFIYRFDVIFTAFGTLWRVVFAWILWGAIFEGRALVGGFSFQLMLSYYVLSSFLATLDMSYGVCGEVSSRIREGSFSKFMVIPSNPLTHFLFQSVGTSGYYGVFAALAAALSALLFGINLAFAIDPARILLAIAMFLMGIVFMNSYQFFAGIWAFKFNDVGWLVMHVLPSVIAFFKGEYVPLALLPTGFENTLRFFPFAHVTYTPTMLMIGQMSVEDGLYGLAILTAWTFGMTAICQSTYKRLRTRYEGVGI